MSAEQMKRLEEGIRRAHEAGNAEHVRRLGAEYRRLQAASSQGAPQEPQEFSFGQRAEAAVDNIAESIADTAQVFGADGLARGLRGVTQTPEGFVSESEKFLRPGEEGYGWQHLPGAAAEQTPQFALALGGAKAGALAGGRIGMIAGPKGAALGAVLGGIFGAAAPEALQVLGPTAYARAQNNGREEPNAEDISAAAATAVASGAINAVSPALRAGIGRVAVEGVTETFQSGTQQTGETLGTEAGWEVDGKQAIGEGIIGAGSAGVVDGTIRGAQAAANVNLPGVPSALSRTDNREFSEDEQRAAEALLRAADGDINVLGNVDDTDAGTAKAAANAALDALRAEAQTIAGGLRDLAKTREDRDALTSINTVLKQAGRQVSTTPEVEIEELIGAFPDTADAKRLASIVRQINVIQDFTKDGTRDMGGLTKFTRMADLTDARNTIKAFTMGGVGIGSVMNPMGTIASVGSGMAVNRAARVIDKITNRRSRVKRFVDSALKEGKRAPNIEGVSAPQALKELRQQREAEASAKRLADQAMLDALKQGNMSALDQSNGPLSPKVQAAAERVAKEQQTRQLEEQATADLFQPGVQVPPPIQGQGDLNPLVQGHYMWQQATGLEPLEIQQTLQEMEADGTIPKGYAQRYRSNIGSFDGDPDTKSLQRMVAQRRGSKGKQDFKPKPPAAPVDPDATLRKLEDRLSRASDRSNFKQAEGQIASAKVLTTIQKFTPVLDLSTRQMLLDLRASIDTPGMKRSDRFSMVNEMLPMILGKPRFRPIRREIEVAFQDLAAAGNDREITLDETEAKKEKALEKRTRAPRKKSKTKGTRQASKKPSPPLGTTEATAERALQKLQEERADPTPEPEAETETAVEAQIVADEPKLDPEVEEFIETGEAPEPVLDQSKPAVKKPATTRTKAVSPSKLRTDFEKEKARIIHAIETASTRDGELADYRDSLPRTAMGQVMGIILDVASDRVTVNMVVDGYARKFDVDPQIAAQRVSAGLTEMVNKQIVSVSSASGRASLLVQDKKPVQDKEGRDLYVRQINFYQPIKNKEGKPTKQSILDPEFADMLDIAKSIKKAEKMVDQEGPAFNYRPGRLTNRDHVALKDIDPRKVDGRFAPLLDPINDLRGQQFRINPRMLDAIEGGLGGVKENELGTIAEVLRPKSENTNRKDDSPLRAAAQLSHHRDETGSDTIYQEFFAGSNGRIYARNGTADTQGGDLMKGIVRAPEAAPVGGEAGLKFVFHGLGNLLGYDKESPKDRRNSIFEKDHVRKLLTFAKDPFARRLLKDDSGTITDIGQMVKDGEGFFQVLNAAYEVENMVNWAKARHKTKATRFRKDPAKLLQDPEVQADMAENYETDFIVQLDASNNAYQNAGTLMGETTLLQETGVLPPPGREGDPDAFKGADIYITPANGVVAAIPELQAADFSQEFVRKLFKNAISTFLYAAEFNSRKETFRKQLKKKAGNLNIVGTSPEDGLLVIPQDWQASFQSEEGAPITQVRYDVEGNPKPGYPKTVLKKVVPAVDKDGKPVTDKDGNPMWKIATKEGRTDKAKFVVRGSAFDTPEAAMREAYMGGLFVRMNQELIRQMNTLYPNVQKFLGYSRTVMEMVREADLDTIQVPTRDGLPLEYSFKENPIYEAAEIDVAGQKARIGIRSKEVKTAGRGLAAFIAHQMDAYVLREVYKRMKEQLGRPPKVFNPIHDSFGFHPSEAELGQRLWYEVMSEQGQEDYNIFLEILEANGIDPSAYVAAGGPVDLIMGRQGVGPFSPQQSPTALS